MQYTDRAPEEPVRWGGVPNMRPISWNSTMVMAVKHRECTKPECVWGYDEISWFARLTEEERSQFLCYAWNWLADNDPAGRLEACGMRDIQGVAGHNSDFYYANNDDYMPYGFNQEYTIRAM